MQVILAHELAERALASPLAGPRSRARAHCAHSRAYVIGGEIGRSLAHLDAALTAVADLPGPRAAVWVERAAAELVGGSLDRAVDSAERAVEHYRGRSRSFETAHALLVLAAAWIARGRRSDGVFAERTLESARSLADRGSFRGIQVGCAILGAALARRRRGGDPIALLLQALAELDPERASIYAGTLVAAIDGGIVASAVPGVSALLAHLGFAESVSAYLVDRSGRRAASASAVARERTARDLFVDVERTLVAGRRGAVEIAGRPLVCAMLAAFVQARGAPLSPEALYTRVWGVTEYHPLRHRSALYVGINRLRACLREIFPERELIERVEGGWRLVDEVDACVAVPVRE